MSAAWFDGWRPGAVVFDCDGLLMDTEGCWSIAETELFARRGLPFGPAEKAQLIGKSARAVAETMAGLFDERGEEAAIERELISLVTEVVSASAEVMPGAIELVERVAGLVPVAIASNSPRPLLDATLARGDLARRAPLSIAADEVTAPKPDPAMYLAACSMLGAAPETVLAFEDSMTGLRSARAAGVRVIGVPTLRDQGLPAEHVLESLLDPALTAWIATWPPSVIVDAR